MVLPTTKYMVNEMGNTFKNMGHLKAVSELEEELEGNTFKFIHV